MRPTIRKNCLCLILSIVLVLLTLQIPKVYSKEDSNQEKALSFLTNVVGFDMAKYACKLAATIDLPSDLEGSPQKSFRYTLESAKSKLDVVCNFRDDKLVWCKIYKREGSLLLIQPSVNTLDVAKTLLQRYQAFSDIIKSQYPYQLMQSTLNLATGLKSWTTTEENVKLEISIEGNLSRVIWIHTVDGLDIRQNTIGFIFDNGTFDSFADDWNLFKVGSIDVRLSMDEAVRIAMERTQKYAYTIGGITVSNFVILEEGIEAELTMQNRGNYTVYPHWSIRLPLTQVYPGLVSEIRVLLWADTGEVTYINAVGSLGSPPAADSTSQSEIDTISPTNDSSFEPQSGSYDNGLGVYLVAGTAAVVIAITVGLSVTVLKKRSK